jgi:hypothetical protein
MRPQWSDASAQAGGGGGGGGGGDGGEGAGPGARGRSGLHALPQAQAQAQAQVQARPGRASLVIAQQAWLGDTLLCEGTIRIGWVDAAAMKPARIPSSVLERLT